MSPKVTAAAGTTLSGDHGGTCYVGDPQSVPLSHGRRARSPELRGLRRRRRGNWRRTSRRAGSGRMRSSRSRAAGCRSPGRSGTPSTSRCSAASTWSSTPASDRDSTSRSCCRRLSTGGPRRQAHAAGRRRRRLRAHPRPRADAAPGRGARGAHRVLYTKPGTVHEPTTSGGARTAGSTVPVGAQGPVPYADRRPLATHDRAPSTRRARRRRLGAGARAGVAPHRRDGRLPAGRGRRGAPVPAGGRARAARVRRRRSPTCACSSSDRTRTRRRVTRSGCLSPSTRTCDRFRAACTNIYTRARRPTSASRPPPTATSRAWARAGCHAAQPGAHGAGRRIRLAPRQGLGAGHRARHPCARRPRRAAGRDPVGAGCRNAAAAARSDARDRVRASEPAVGIRTDSSARGRSAGRTSCSSRQGAEPVDWRLPA